jgi:hypothetical protein
VASSDFVAAASANAVNPSASAASNATSDENVALATDLDA